MDEEKKPDEVAAGNTGLPKNLAGALCYSLGWLTGLIFLLLEKDKGIRFHALQSIVVFGGLMVAQLVLGATVILEPVGRLVPVVGFILWLVLIYKTYNGEKYLVPVVGMWVEKQVSKMK